MNPFTVEVCRGSSLAEIEKKLNGQSEYYHPRLNFLVTETFRIHIHHAQGHREMFKDAGLYAEDCLCNGTIEAGKRGGAVRIGYRCQGLMLQRQGELMNKPDELEALQSSYVLQREQIRDAINSFLRPMWRQSAHLLELGGTSDLGY